MPVKSIASTTGAHACKNGSMEKPEPSPRHGATPDLSGVELEFPVTFDLKVIYVLEGGESIVQDLEAIYKANKVGCALIQGVAKPGAKYGKMGSRLRFESKAQMYATYEAIGKLPYVKTAI